MHKPKAILVIMDGWGFSPVHEGNAIWAAKTPTFDYLWNVYSHTLLNSFGENVGLPWGSIGSSEVGHSAIGSGRLIFHELSLIDKEIADKTFFKNERIATFLQKSKKSGDIHLIGLLSNGGVHSHVQHLYSLMEYIKKVGIHSNIYVHVITDGRDTGPKSAIQFIEELDSFSKKIGLDAKIASVSGRYYAMDRDNRWERTQKAYLAMTAGKGEIYNSAKEAVEANYARDVSDEFIVPSVIRLQDNKPGLINKLFQKKDNKENTDSLGMVKPGDSVIFFNIRPDRMRQITEVFLFKRADIKTEPVPRIKTMTMATYNDFLPVFVAYPTTKVKNPIAKLLSDHKIRQGHFAETEKYVHVTYFFNGANSEPFPHEYWHLVPSSKVATYDLAPEMSAREITDEVFDKVEKEKLDFVLINYANADMVGHTGKFSKVVKAVETVDAQLKRLLKFTPESTIIITADHGNAECMVHPETGEIDKHHTVNPVPLIFVNEKFKRRADTYEESEPAGILADIAPTILELFNIKRPHDMNGVSLIDNFKHKVDLIKDEDASSETPEEAKANEAEFSKQKTKEE